MRCLHCNTESNAGGAFCPFCGKRLEAGRDEAVRSDGDGMIATMPSGEADAPKPMERGGLDRWARYFAHGLLFSLALSLISIMWLSSTFLLILAFRSQICFGIVVLGAALCVLIIVVACLNTMLAEKIWGLRLEHDRKNLFTHGFVLISFLTIVSFPSMVIMSATTDVAVMMALFLAYCFIDGYVGKWVAS